jgi:hypothetical protein
MYQLKVSLKFKKKGSAIVFFSKQLKNVGFQLKNILAILKESFLK